MEAINGVDNEGGVVFFGELLMRLAPPGHTRFVQARSFDVAYTGAEANAAVTLTQFGIPTYLVSCVPENPIGDACIDFFRQYGVNTDFVRRTESRLGTFYLETGAAQRASKVIYDRAHSGFSLLGPDSYSWDEILDGKRWLHISGTAPAVSENSAAATRQALESAVARGVKSSLDLNFRSRLWQWREGTSAQELAREIIPAIVDTVDVIIGNEEDAYDVLGIRAGSTEVDSGQLDYERYPEVARKIAERFPRASYVALTLRESKSASHNRWGALIYDVGRHSHYFAPSGPAGYTPFEIVPIVDRVGAGDSFSGALIYGLLSGMGVSESLELAVAASCLKHSVEGDFNLISLDEAKSLMRGNTAGRIRR